MSVRTRTQMPWAAAAAGDRAGLQPQPGADAIGDEVAEAGPHRRELVLRIRGGGRGHDLAHPPLQLVEARQEEGPGAAEEPVHVGRRDADVVGDLLDRRGGQAVGGKRAHAGVDGLGASSGRGRADGRHARPHDRSNQLLTTCRFGVSGNRARCVNSGVRHLITAGCDA
jgi:hypothetical protein